MRDPMERKYLEMRRRQSEKMAQAAADPAVARVHLELAARYAARIGDDS